MIWPMRRCSALERCSRPNPPRPIPISLQFLNVHRLDLPIPGSLPAGAPKPWATRARILWDTSSRWQPPKKTTRPSHWRPSAGRPAIPWPKAAPDRPGLCPQVATDGAIRSPLNCFRPSIEGLHLSDRWQRMGRDRRWIVSVLRRSPIASRNPRLPWPPWGCQQRFQPLLDSPRFQPTQQITRQRRGGRSDFVAVAH